jgi:small redox-active disulfide protein 2
MELSSNWRNKMKKIEILGTGCPKCSKLYQVTEEAVKSLGLECELEKVTDIQQITAFGVMMTPALAVDGQVKIAGKVPSKEDIMKMLV